MSTFSSGLQFRVIDGQKEKDRIIRLDGKELVLGRAQKGQRPGQGEVLFREPTVSRVHANLSWKERKGGFQLTHKSGTNPTLVNGKPTKKILLAPGDRVQMGLLILELEDTPGGRTASSGSTVGGDTRSRSSMTEPILEALNKVERQHEEDRRRARVENEQKQRQREIMASAEPFEEMPRVADNSRSRRLDEALRAAPPRPEDERKKRKGGPSFGWQPPEERDTPPPPPLRHQFETPPVGPNRLKEVSYEEERGNRRIPLTPDLPETAVEAPTAPARREAVYELVVVKGPDQGRRFPLKDMVMVLGQRQGDHDERDGQGVLLNDATMPAELGMFAWQGREGSYGLLASENSMQIIEVDRISDGARRRIRVDSASSILLKVADEIQVGLTTLRVQKIGEPVPVFKARLNPPAEVIPAPASPAPRVEPSAPPVRRSLANPESASTGTFPRPAPTGPARPPASPWRESTPPPRPSPPPASQRASQSLANMARSPEPPTAPPDRGQRETPLPSNPTLNPSPPPGRTSLGDMPTSISERVPREFSTPVQRGRDIGVGPPRESEPEVPLWAQATLVPGRDQSTSPPPTSAAAPKPARPANSDDLLEWGTRPNVDFLFEFTTGPMRGCVVTMNRSDLARPKRYNAGTIGSRHNDVSLEGADIPNEAFHLVGEEGRFSLCNEAPTGALMINRSPMKTGDRLVLMTGDVITLGQTQVRFLERDVVKVLAQHGLLAESGVTTDQDRVFGLSRQRMMIGRGKGCDVRLADLEVSRVHLGLAYSEGRFSVQHRSETNPTFLNGLSLMPGTVRTLKVGDRIRLSSLTVLRFVER